MSDRISWSNPRVLAVLLLVFLAGGLSGAIAVRVVRNLSQRLSLLVVGCVMIVQANRPRPNRLSALMTGDQIAANRASSRARAPSNWSITMTKDFAGCVAFSER